MTIAQTAEPARHRPLLLWPGVVIVTLQHVVRYGVPVVAPDLTMWAIIGGILGGALATLVWWLFLSRAPWSERLGAIALMVVGVYATSFIVDKSVSNGMMGFMLYFYSIPALCLALVAGSVISRRLDDGGRRVALAASILVGCGIFALIRTGGISGGGDSDLHWRWTKTPEERLLAQAVSERTVVPPAPAAVNPPEELPPAQAGGKPGVPPSAPAAAETPGEPRLARAPGDPGGNDRSGALPAAPAAARTEPAGASATKTRADWPSFRGPGRDGVVHGVKIKTDWSASPPVELWRRPIGPGWSSFAVRGELLYTQEQRGGDEIVACYSVTTGQPVWMHRDAARFWESNAGAGPRATPTLSKDRVYTFGATGILNALNASDGAVVWSRNAASDTGKKVPGWGFSSSPLVVDDLVVVHAGVLVAYDLATGSRRWSGPARQGSYSSPHLLTIDGIPQILMISNDGIISVAPADGTLLWEYAWDGVSIIQPAQIAGGDLLLSSAGSGAEGVGSRRIAVAHGPGGWTVAERWISTGLKPSFNDFVIHDGHAFGFDGSILSCINLEDGKRKWKGGRYGNGQLVLLAEQDVLLVMSEEGELALVGATADQFTELARFPALNAKTWNHPVVAGDVLLVRNGEEMAAFRLPLAAAEVTMR
jgi:outer membrane protein assembly factor BamB